MELPSGVVDHLAVNEGLCCKVQDAVTVIQPLALQGQLVQGGVAVAVVQAAQGGVDGAASRDEAAAVVNVTL